MNFRATKILCTIGPATNSKENICHLVEGGMNVVRVNLSHGERENHRELVRMIKDLNASGTFKKLNPQIHAVAIMLDTKGAEIRTSALKQPMRVEEGQEVVFSSNPLPDEKRPVIVINYPSFGDDVQRADQILLDNGEMIFDLVSIEKDGTVIARAKQSGLIGSRRHVNLPGANVDLPSVTDKDWDDIAFAADEGVDFIALSFVQYGKNVDEVREFLRSKGSTIQLISKIESQRAVQNISEIIHASDGIMVARGDLGAEMPFESIPVIQDNIVAFCQEAGKPVIVATHMLESMITRPTPTRAEVTDIAHAVHTGADATMLSGETAAGKNPLAALDAMDRVIRATEEHLARTHREPAHVNTEREARALAAVTLANSTSAAAIMVITKSGQTAIDISRFRPGIPIIASTNDPAVQRRLELYYGVIPLQCELKEDPEAAVHCAMKNIRELEPLLSGSRVVLVSDMQARDLTVNSIQIRTIE